MNNADDNKNTGLPKVANESREKRTVMIVLCLVGAIFIASYWHSKKTVKNAPPLQETYTVVASANSDLKPQSTIKEEDKSKAIKPEIIQQQLALIQAKQKELQQRLIAPLMLVNGNAPAKDATGASPAMQASRDQNSQFLNQVSNQKNETVTATKIGPLNEIIAEGNLIHAILEPAINSDLPGSLRAIVNEVVYSEDGSQILIPSGSRLIGQYKSGISQGQSRIFIVWTRLITPDGISVQLGSEGVDSLGEAGMNADEIDRHFWERFGTASLLSLIGAGTANVGVHNDTPENSAASYRSAVANSFSESASQSLQQDNMVAPTLIEHQGKPIIVFVAHDLDFHQIIKNKTSNRNIF